MARIHEAICAMVAECEHIGKEKQSQQGYKFRGIDDVYNTVHPLLAKHKVFSTSKIKKMSREERETKQGGVLFYTRLKMEYTFWADDGSTITTEVIGEGMDSSDKGTNKAMSIAYKYALFQMLCIPTEAIDPDADAKEEIKAREKRDIEAEKAAHAASKQEPERREQSAKPACPECGKTETVFRDKDNPTSFYCWKKKEGCGAKWTTGSGAGEGDEGSPRGAVSSMAGILAKVKAALDKATLDRAKEEFDKCYSLSELNAADADSFDKAYNSKLDWIRKSIEASIINAVRNAKDSTEIAGIEQRIIQRRASEDILDDGFERIEKVLEERKGAKAAA